MRAGPVGLVIIQSTSFCNLDCSYCYLPDRQSRARVSPETVRRIFERITESAYCPSVMTVVWHAGEPTAMPIALYRDLFNEIDAVVQGRIEIQHSFQTNATLITAEWCDFFRERNVRVGVSLDGPEDVHDAHRRYRSGLGSFANTLRGLRLLQNAGLQPSVISVVTGSLLARADEYHSLMCEEGVSSIGLNVEEIEGIHQESTLLVSDLESQWLSFLGRLLDLSRVSGIRIRELESVKKIIAAGGTSYDVQSQPFAILSFSSTGDFSTFSPELLTANDGNETFVYGNVHTDSLDSALESPKLQRHLALIEEGRNMCRATCDYFSHCGGGIPVNKFAENGTFASAETMQCRFGRKILTDAVLDVIEAEMDSGRGAADHDS